MYLQVFSRSILCNWLVCVAVYQSSAAKSLPGKLLGLWPPIAAFVAMGLEHSIANQFFIPMGESWLHCILHSYRSREMMLTADILMPALDCNATVSMLAMLLLAESALSFV